VDLGLVFGVSHDQKLTALSDLLLSHGVVTDRLEFEGSAKVPFRPGSLPPQEGLQSLIGDVRRLCFLVKSALSLVLNGGVLIEYESEGIVARVQNIRQLLFNDIVADDLLELLRHCLDPGDKVNHLLGDYARVRGPL